MLAWTGDACTAQCMTDRCSAPDGAPCTAQQVCEVIGDHVALCKPTFACTLKRPCEQGGMRQALADAWLASGTAASPSTTTGYSNSMHSQQDRAVL